MIPFDTFDLAAVVSELRRALDDSRVQRIYQPVPTDLILAFYGRCGAHRLLLSAHPKYFRVHLTQMRRENPVTPLAFCQVCRKDLEGAWLDEITLPRFDRVLHLRFRTADGEPVRLIAELMGRNSNLVLVSGVGTVRGVMRPVPPGERTLRPGAAYVDPPGYHDRLDPFALGTPLPPAGGETGEGNSLPTMIERVAGESLSAVYSGIGKFAEAEIKARVATGVLDSDENALRDLMRRVRAYEFDPHSIGDTDGHTQGVWAFEPLSVPTGLRFRRESISVALDTFYATQATQEAEESEKTSLAKTIARETAYRKKELASARATLAEAGRADEYEQQGNLLLANLFAIERGAIAVTVTNFYDENAGSITLTLDPKKSGQENAESYFARARKARDAAEYADGHAADLEDELERLAALSVLLSAANEGDDLERFREALAEIVGEARATGKPPADNRPRPKGSDKPFGGHKVRTYNLDGGYILYVGETAEANDHLITRVAAPSDLWFHVRAGTGAHGVLRTNKLPDRVPEKILYKAAEIVAFRSGSVKHAGVVAVDITERRHVRKPRGAKAGLAMYTRARTLDVAPGL